MDQVRNIVLSALEKDIYRRYISVVPLQADGRLEISSACLGILSPQPGEKFVIINDTSSIIIARKPIAAHEDKVISTIVFGSGTDDKKKWRLRLPQVPLRILLACKIGFRAFRYGDEVALEAEPYLPPTGAQLYNISSIEDLAPFILRDSRSILHIDCIAVEQKIHPTELGFRLLGEYWIRRYHQDPLDSEFKHLRCSGNSKCIYCESGFLIVKTVYWFPVVGYNYQQHYARPSLISFRIPSMESVCADLANECEIWAESARASGNAEMYCDKGIVTYDGKALWKISSDGKISLTKVKEDEGLTTEEKGLMKIALKELETYIDKFDGVVIN